ncbi:MAG: type II toxin-antitoxin system RelE/ParE family toxin [Flavobacteriales bacterium]|nr:type II toxin-antitoxin system RelE/ParE family toxin [Flavobacteriales bacterium]
MAAQRKIEWTPEAREQLTRIYQFVESQWSARIAERFLDLVFAFEDLVVRYPNGFRASATHPDIRLGLIHRNVKAVYRVEPDRIVIITLLDTRADNRDWF